MKTKKIGALLLAGALAVGTLTGCGNAVTAESLVKKAQEKTSAATYVEGTVNLEMSMGVETQGLTLTLPVDLNMTVHADKEKNAYMSASIGMSLLGQDTEQKQELYITGGQMYSKTDESGWSAGTTVASDAELDMEELMEGPMAWDDKITYTLGSEENIDGKQAHKVTGTLSGENMKEALKNITDAMGDLSSLGDVFGGDTDSSEILDLDSIDFSKLNLTFDYWIQEDGTIVRFECDMTEAINTILNDVIAKALGGELGDAASIEVSKMIMTGSNMKFETSGTVAAPSDFSAGA